MLLDRCKYYCKQFYQHNFSVGQGIPKFFLVISSAGMYVNSNKMSVCFLVWYRNSLLFYSNAKDLTVLREFRLQNTQQWTINYVYILKKVIFLTRHKEMVHFSNKILATYICLVRSKCYMFMVCSIQLNLWSNFLYLIYY